MKYWDSLFLLLLLMATIGFVTGQTPSSTECTQNPNSPACQDPVYTDDNSKYLHDLRASWVLNGGQPSDSGITVLHGTKAGDIDSLNSDTSSSGEKTEWFIDGAGAAGSSNFGRGTLDSSNIVLPGASGSDDVAEYLINSPNNKEAPVCGDGYQNFGDSYNCPQGHRLCGHLLGAEQSYPGRP